MRLFALGVLAALLAAPVGAGAQDAARPPEGTVFRQLFPQPTGRNGYEELVMAGELARAGESRHDLSGADVKLSEKQAGLNEPDRRRALELLRLGLTKPIRSPRAGKPADANTPFPDFLLLRALGRLLAVDIYVQAADGRMGMAIDSLRDGLRIGYLVQSEFVIGGLVGIAIDAMVLQSFARHLDQLSARDCDRLIALANEWLRMPDPAVTALAREQEMATLSLTPTLNALPFKNEVLARMDMEYARLQADARRPAWERTEPPPLPDDTEAARWFKAVCEPLRAALSRSMEKWTLDLAQVQLLGLHAAIRRYRWEHNRLPASLDDLKTGRLATDPFTGRPLSYRVTGETTYDLYSAGPTALDEEGRPIAGQREPLYLPRKPKPQ